MEVRAGDGIDAGTSFTLNPEDFSVVDSGGREYPLLALEPKTLTLEPGRLQTVVVRADGSPHWFTTKFYELEIARDAVGNRDPIRLKRALSNVRKRTIEE